MANMTAIIQMFEDSILSKKKQIDKAENTEDIMALLTFTDDEKEKLHKKLHIMNLLGIN